jgi:DNA-binding NarL/FixJ family response regulator
MGYDVAGIAPSGKDAVTLADEGRPDIVLMDIQLQGPMSGTEAARIISQRTGAAIIFITAFAAAFLRDPGEMPRLGICLSKPFSKYQLKAALETGSKGSTYELSNCDRHSHGAPMNAQQPRVVIAENFVLIQEMIRDLLEPECDVVAMVEDGQAAIKAVETHRPDILLLDVSLPLANGFAVTEKIQQSHPEIKVVFVTAYADPGYVERAFASGASGYVLKGSIRTDLLGAIRDVMEGRPYRSPLLA